MISSVNSDQHQILRDINKLHLEGEWIQVDACYGNGSFYNRSDIPKPQFCFDLDPKFPFVQKLDCTDMDGWFEANEIRSIIFDPPFLQTTGAGSIIKNRFGSYPSMTELWDMYRRSLSAFHHVLRTKGVLIVKMQNTVMGGKQWWSVDLINTIAHDLHFYKKDELILAATNRLPLQANQTQKHARKFHSYFLVFEK